MSNALKRFTIGVVIGMLIFMPTSMAQVRKRSICGKVVSNTNEAAARTEVHLYFEDASLIPGAVAEAEGSFCIENFVDDLSRTAPAQLYVTSFCRAGDLTLVNVPFWPEMRKEPQYAGKRIIVGPGEVTSAGSVDVQIVYGHVGLRIVDHRQRPLLTGTNDWSPLWIRVRDRNGVTVHESGLSPMDIETSVDLKESRINLALPKGTWNLEVALTGVPSPTVRRRVRWRRVPGQVRVESCATPVDVTLTVAR
jgi:hypothetical protein